MEQKTCQAPLLWEQSLGWLCRWLQEYRVPFFSTLLIGLLSYTYAFTNKLPNHDDITCLFFKGESYSSGRWGLEIMERIFPDYSMPWIYGVITLLLMAAAVCVIVHIFHIQSKLLQGLLGGCIVVFPSLIATFSYMFTVSSYGVSFLLAVTAVLFLRKETLLSQVFAVGSMVVSLSIYQSYISIAAGLLLLVLIQDLLEGKDLTVIFRKGIWYVAFLALSLGLYYAAMKLINAIKGIEFNSYASSSLQFSLADIPVRIMQAYQDFPVYFTSGLHGLVLFPLSRGMHLICLISIAVLLAVWFLRQSKKDWGRLLFLLALIALLPLAINCMYLFTGAEAVHSLVLYGFISVYVLAVILADACPDIGRLVSRATLHILTLALAVIITVNIYAANMVSLHMQLQYENTYGFYSSLATQLKMTPEFSENTKLAIVGYYQQPEHFGQQFAETSKLAGVNAMHPDVYSKQRFLEYYLGLKIPFATEAEIAAIEAAEAYQTMPVYPYYGSVQMIGDTLVVKLSE